MLAYYPFFIAMKAFWTLKSPIMDCDEVFNYWEPLHYLTYGTGFQTWEYAPEFALRSYAYILMNKYVLRICSSVATFFTTLLLIISPTYGQYISLSIIEEQIFQFFLLRGVLGLINLCAEVVFCEKVASRYGIMAGRFAAGICLIAPGFGHTSVAFLPSSSNLTLGLLIYSLWMMIHTEKEKEQAVDAILEELSSKSKASEANVDLRNRVVCYLTDRFGLSNSDFNFQESTRKMVSFESLRATCGTRLRTYYMLAMFLVSVACFLWPYVALSFLPLGIEALLYLGLFKFLGLCICCTLVSVGIPTYIDSTFYGDTVISVLNQLQYNLAGGSNLYGVEPWTFYLKNLVVNFNFALLLAWVALPLAVVIYKQSLQGKFSTDTILELKLINIQDVRRGLLVETGCYLFPVVGVLGFFSTVGHKEERFLTQVYPSIALGAALTLSMIWRLELKQHKQYLQKVAIAVLVFAFVVLSLSRSLAIVSQFHAPITSFKSLSKEISGNKELKEAGEEIHICMGDNWYHFPSSFFSATYASKKEHQQQTAVGWLRSDFDGLLPQPYGPYPDGIRTTLGRFNAQNKAEDVHVPVDWCDFIVAYDHQDTGFASLRSESEIEVISCERLLNLDKSSPGWRSFYVPLQAMERLISSMSQELLNLLQSRWGRLN